MFTPGPWKVGELADREDGDGSDERLVCTSDNGLYIGSIWPIGEDFGSDDYPVREANARLIAQAPTAHQLIREALQGFTELVEFYGSDNGETPHGVPHLDINDWIKSARAYLVAVEGK